MTDRLSHLEKAVLVDKDVYIVGAEDRLLPDLLAVARAARGFESAYQMALGSASAFDVLNRDEHQRELRRALARLEAGEQGDA